MLPTWECYRATKHLSAWLSDVSEQNNCIINSNFQYGAFTAYLE